MAGSAENQESLMEEELQEPPEDEAPGHDVVIIFAVFFEAGLAPFSLILGWLLGHQPLEKFVWSAGDALWGAAAAVPLIALFLAMLRWPIGPLIKVKEFCEEEIVPLFDESYWSELALISLSAGVGEEMLFRGVLQATLMDWLGAGWGLTLASVLFGVLHPISISYIIIAGFLGLYLGAIWIYSDNLLTVMVTHGLYDFVALGYLIRLTVSGSEPWRWSPESVRKPEAESESATPAIVDAGRLGVILPGFVGYAGGRAVASAWRPDGSYSRMDLLAKGSNRMVTNQGGSTGGRTGTSRPWRSGQFFPAVFLLVAACVLGGPAPRAEAAEVLRWKFKPGETLRFSIEQKMMIDHEGDGTSSARSNRTETRGV